MPDNIFKPEPPEWIRRIAWLWEVFPWYLQFLKSKKIPFPKICFIISVFLILTVVAKFSIILTKDTGHFEYEFYGKSYQARKAGIPTTIDGWFEGKVTNISSESRYLQHFHHVLWRSKFLGRAWDYGYGTGFIYEINGNERATSTLPILFRSNESKRLAWSVNWDLSDPEIYKAYAERDGVGVFTWGKNAPYIFVEDSRGNIFDEQGKLVSQVVTDTWWVLPNNKTVSEKIKAYSDLTAKIILWRIQRFFHWLG